MAVAVGQLCQSVKHSGAAAIFIAAHCFAIKNRFPWPRPGGCRMAITHFHFSKMCQSLSKPYRSCRQGKSLPARWGDPGAGCISVLCRVCPAPVGSQAAPCNGAGLQAQTSAQQPVSLPTQRGKGECHRIAEGTAQQAD